MTFPSTRGDTRPPAEICRERGWSTGTKLAANDGQVIQITAVGESRLLGKTVFDGGRNYLREERELALYMRDWQPVDTTDDNASLQRHGS